MGWILAYVMDNRNIVIGENRARGKKRLVGWGSVSFSISTAVPLRFVPIRITWSMCQHKSWTLFQATLRWVASAVYAVLCLLRPTSKWSFSGLIQISWLSYSKEIKRWIFFLRRLIKWRVVVTALYNAAFHTVLLTVIINQYCIMSLRL